MFIDMPTSQKEVQRRVQEILLSDPEVAREFKRRALARTGTQNGRAKLDEVDVCLMRSMHKVMGLSISEIAKRRKLPRETVRDIIKRRTWTHV